MLYEVITAAKDRTARKETGIRSARESIVFQAPKLLSAAELTNKKVLELESPRNCYVCKAEFTKLHHFYDTMCTECGDFNYAKRFQTADLRGQVAVITGSVITSYSIHYTKLYEMSVSLGSKPNSFNCVTKIYYSSIN